MVKIDRVSVENFKNIESADVTFGNLNVLVGANGSGKSNFLSLISFLDTIINGSAETIKVLFRTGFGRRFRHFYTQENLNKDGENNIKTIGISIDFSNTTTNHIYRYDIKICQIDPTGKEVNFKIYSESLSYKLKTSKGKASSVMVQENGKLTISKTISTNFVDVQMTDSSTSGVKILDALLKTNPKLNESYGHILASLNTILKAKTVYLSSHAMKYFDSESPGSAEGRLVKFNLEEQIKEIYETEKWKEFLQAVKNVTNIDDVVVVKPSENQEKILKTDSFVAYFYSSRIVFLEDLSDGEILLIGLICQIITSTQDIIFFEELENSIHPKALESLIDLINSQHNDKQVLISTHSATLLNMVKPEDVFISVINDSSLAEITMIPNVKEMKRKLSKGFINFGDLFYQGDDDKFEDIFE